MIPRGPAIRLRSGPDSPAGHAGVEASARPVNASTISGAPRGHAMPLPRARFTVRWLMTISVSVAVYFACLNRVWSMLRPGSHPGGLAAFLQGLAFFVVFLLPPR